MALPIEPTPPQLETIRRLIVVFSLWSARRPHGQLAVDPRLDAAADALALEASEREALVDYEGSPERFSFFNRRAANWLFGQRLATVVGHPGDWSVAAPAAAWAIHAIKAANEAVTAR